MPNYQYECKCGHKFEKRVLISKRNKVSCPECGNKNPDRLIGGSSGFVFKGDGCYASIKKEEEMYTPMKRKKK